MRGISIVVSWKALGVGIRLDQDYDVDNFSEKLAVLIVSNVNLVNKKIWKKD